MGSVGALRCIMVVTINLIYTLFYISSSISICFVHSIGKVSDSRKPAPHIEVKGGSKSICCLLVFELLASVERRNGDSAAKLKSAISTIQADFCDDGIVSHVQGDGRHHRHKQTCRRPQ